MANDYMPAAGASTIGTGRLPGQEAIDLSVCLAILKKAIVAIPLLIMIVLYLIRCNMPSEDQTTLDPTDSFISKTNAPNLTVNDNSNFTQNFENTEEQLLKKQKEPLSLVQTLRHRKTSKRKSVTKLRTSKLHNPWSSRNLRKFLSAVMQPLRR